MDDKILPLEKKQEQLGNKTQKFVSRKKAKNKVTPGEKDDYKGIFLSLISNLFVLIKMNICFY